MYIYSNYHLGWRHIFSNIYDLILGFAKGDQSKNIKQFWKYKTQTDNDMFITYSCRSAFDLLLSALNLEKDAEIIFTSLTIRNMVNFAEHHGLKVVPLDIDIKTTNPLFDQLDNCLSSKTRLIVLTHLFGIRISPEVIAEITRRVKDYNKNIIVVEDIAQSFYCLNGTSNTHKHPNTDVGLYSFGTSKTFSSIKGGILEINPNLNLSEGVNSILNSWPVVPRKKTYNDILVTSIGLMLSVPWITNIFTQILSGLFSMDFETFINRYFTAYPTRSNSKGCEDFTKIVEKTRYRPCYATLNLMYNRFITMSKDQSLNIKGNIGRFVCNSLKDVDQITIPGRDIVDRNYWIFSICIHDNKVEPLQKLLIKKGFGVSRTATTFGTVDNFITDKSSPRYKKPVNAVNFVNNVLYIPVTDAISIDKASEMTNLIRQYFNKE